GLVSNTAVFSVLPLFFRLFLFYISCSRHHRACHSFPTRRSSDLLVLAAPAGGYATGMRAVGWAIEGLAGPRTLRVALPRALDAQDRKSTRLNSSHVAISYAVFCLKKTTYTTI